MIDTESIAALHEKHSCPAYLFDLDVLDERIKEVRKRLETAGEGMRLCYAVKANPFLVRHLKDSGVMFEACSRGELEICAKEGVNPSSIVFSGVVKTKEDIERALLLGVLTVTLESPVQCGMLCECVKEGLLDSEKTDVILRLASACQFGMCADDLKSVLKTLMQMRSVHVRGIHFFTGTQKKIDKIKKEVEFITRFCDALKGECGFAPCDIEYGPGLAVDYFGAQNTDDYEELESFVQAVKGSGYKFTVEMGRYLAASCGYYVTKIMDVKAADPLLGSGVAGYVMTDGGINHINYYGQMLGMKVPPVVHIKGNGSRGGELPSNDGDKEHWTVCGSLCTTADVIVRSLPMACPAPGECLVFSNIGAYSVTEGMYLFLSHALPAIYTTQGGTITERRGCVETWTGNC